MRTCVRECVASVSLTMCLASCVIPSGQEAVRELTREEWETYYELACHAYNDSAIWEACGKELPIDDMQLSPYRAPWGIGPGVTTGILTGVVYTNRDMVTVNVPIWGEGVKRLHVGGVPHVSIYFHYPSKQVRDIRLSGYQF